MNNKLSELSKPVAWEVKGILCHSEEEARIYVGEPDLLYSQEYVSALLQRITELERTNQSQDDHINQQQDRIDSLEKTNAGLGQRLGAAEKRLATPVRLPKRWDVSGQVNPPRIVEVQFEQQNRTHDQCAEAIRAATLAQPVSSGYTLPDGWKLVPVEPTAEMINAALASGALSIRSAYRLMLAAAPEGGNDHDTRR
ncbi:hypothetical protein [Serratia marcescens]|uniref:hypothetical protein n=1 Tax=Serratia marcescens TaxID=615 RepID=UPI0027653982|nr:hypothetical protein [Serratia marcescens]MDP8648029.1 hypothetical protein [Serratia marcescens]